MGCIIMVNRPGKIFDSVYMFRTHQFSVIDPPFKTVEVNKRPGVIVTAHAVSFRVGVTKSSGNSVCSTGITWPLFIDRWTLRAQTD